MAPVTSLCHEPNPVTIRTRTALVGSLLLVIAAVTGASLLTVQKHFRTEVSHQLADDLTQAANTARSMQGARMAALRRENALLADLPSLKALMTTSDQRTIADGAVEFWQISGDDLFALADNGGRVLVAYTRDRPADSQLTDDLTHALAQPQGHLLYTGGRLFEFSEDPLYFGDQRMGTGLGFIITGYAINQTFASEMSQTSQVSTSFLAGREIIASTLSPVQQRQLRTLDFAPLQKTFQARLGQERFLGMSQRIAGSQPAPLQIVMLKSFDKAEHTLRELDRLLFVIGVCAVIGGSALMLSLSEIVTRPLEMLAAGVRAFGTGDSAYVLPTRGPVEVLQLSYAFDRMRVERAATQKALLESERLATIGRMASSVSHDLRHYLAAVYANAEFLASDSISKQEREELFNEITAAVNGTTDLIDSLLIFSRNGANRAAASVAQAAERALALLRMHPDAEGVLLESNLGESAESTAQIDARQVERAIYNLLLNACQAKRGTGVAAKVAIELGCDAENVILTVADNGSGVPEVIRSSLFEPFVSEGKQKGTGLGLTLANSIAREHGGEVQLVRSSPEGTAFRFRIARNLASPRATVPLDSGGHKYAPVDSNVGRQRS
jgi:signal transduction histidine kinase